ncbi:hypothetical protein DOTSEDRAFT_68639 [Dothistroma septosporum NZE10]|uniref:FAD/NAD(P)-binding domain-containing protein n=1 Tax=Dothistroma septosporum (strain NZE10 / CBS 128990) TaxID=675120 RepID=N1Q510_DOTSN|nr:hypothetical protein DOTSEDRAFT_68639 [Dothistroma septosporum NZE10]
MSAIPTLPEHIININGRNADAARDHVLKSEASAMHIERATVTTNDKINRHTNGPSTAIPPWLLHDAPIENQRPIKVIVIGAGYSGIYCGIRVPERLRNCELVIYDKNDGIGGTWYENHYPGAACDIPSHSYQFSFNPNVSWSALYAPAGEIRDYLQDTARKYGADRFMKLKHEVLECTWDSARGKWIVMVRRPDGEIFKDESDVLIGARGLLNNKQWPDIEGLNSFQGEVMHSADWNDDYDFTNKRIGVIGSGSSAIQIIPSLQKVAGAHLNCFMRSKTWISPPLGQSSMDKLGMGEQLQFRPEQIEHFKKDPEAWMEFRMLVEADANNIHASTLKDSEMSKAAMAAFDEGMKISLAKKPHYYDWLRPNFAPGCRRLTPGPGFLEALVEDNVTFTRDKISRIDSTGITTEDGTHHEIDVLVCATGFYASAAPPFKVAGINGRTMQDHWADRSYNYLSLTTDQFPNHFFMLGPNGAIAEGSLTMMIESTGTYILKAIRKIQRDNIKSMSIKPRLVRDFTRYCDAYFEGTVFKDDCNSWYRKNGQGVPSDKVTGLWPGSTLHCIEAMRSPRWEDYDYEYLSEENGSEVNLMGWLGNGWGVTQLGEPTREQLAFYLMPMFQERDIGVPVCPRSEENEQYEIRPWSY